jgi:hypothetical protein
MGEIINLKTYQTNLEEYFNIAIENPIYKFN